MRTNIRVVMRQLAIMLLSTCLIILPMSAHALGFGNIRIKSALNEPLNAEIELLSATTSDLKGLKIKLAAREAFLRAGIERPSHLSQLKFSIKRRSNGRAYLKITTRQSVREPFLDFLLEMNWKNGRMLREYTVLLDPPDRLQPQPTIVESARTESPQIVAQQEQQDTSTPFIEPEPVFSEEQVVVDEPLLVESIAATDVGEEPAPLAEAISESELQLTEVPLVDGTISIAEEDAATAVLDAEEGIDESTEGASDEAYVDPFEGEKFPRIPIKLDKRLRLAEEAVPVEPKQPHVTEPALLADASAAADELAPSSAQTAVDSVTTRRNDNLWNIAEAMRADESVSIYQVMMALLQSNPEAFIDSNVHRLKVGKVLRIDDPSLLTAMSQSQAAQQYIAQTQDWEDYRQQFAQARSTPTQAAMVGDVETSLSEVLPEDLQAETSGELVLAAPEGDNQTTGSTGDEHATVNNEVVILREQIRRALAEADAEGNRNIILNEKLRDLESQLQTLQRSVTVQDDELATLQTQLSELNKKNIEAERAQQAEIAAAQSEAEVAALAESGATDDAVMSEAELLAQVQQAESAEQGLSEPAAVEKSVPVTEPDKLIGPDLMAKIFAILDGIKQRLAGIVSALPVSPLILAIATGMIIVLFLVMLLLMQRRRQAVNFQESILSGIPSHEIMASEEASLDTNLSGESSFLSDFAISGASALQGEDGDVDPLTEADVFMAYGRYEAAEERILEAINKDPDRQELRIKLLELYNTTKNKASFESAAAELYSNLGSDAANPLWQKVVAMGAILAADNPLFSESGGEDVTRIRNKEDVTRIREPEQAKTDELLDLNLENSEVKDEPSIDDLGLDLDFAVDNEPGNALDFDLELDAVSETAAPVEKSAELDLNFDSDESIHIDSSAVAFETSDEETAETAIALDFDISEMDKKVPELDLQLAESNATSIALTLDMDVDTAQTEVEAEQQEGSLALDMSQATFNDAEMPTMQAEVDAADIAELDSPSTMDEVGTKLDLAKAYIDMGDPDGARSILDEVLEEGTQPQQQEAQQLMQQI